MRILFATTKLEKICTDSKKAAQVYGSKGGNRLLLRLQQLHAAPLLADMRGMPGRCHELTGDLHGYLSVDLEGPYRLLFVPEPPVPLKDDGGLDWAKVEGIVIQRVENTHD